MSFDFNHLGIKLPLSWKTVRISDVAEINAELVKKNNEPEEIWYIDISSVSSGEIDNLRKIKYSDAPSRARRRLKNNDIIISTVRPNLRQHAFLEVVGEDWVASTGFCTISARDPETAWYLYSILTSDIFYDYLERVADGGAYPAFNPKEIESAIIPWPDNYSLKKINYIVKILENKIHLNNQINDTLESIAQAIFKSWFIDYEPVKAKMAVLSAGGSNEDAEIAAMKVISSKDDTSLKQLREEQPEYYDNLAKISSLFPSAMQKSALGLIPVGWKLGVLSDLIDFNPKRTLIKGLHAPYLDMKNVPTRGHLARDVVEREVGSGTKFLNGDTLLARITPCLENGKTAYVDFLDKDQVGWGSTEYIVMRPKKEYPSSIGYFIARSEIFRLSAIQSMTGTSGRQRANVSALNNLPWVLYPMELTNIFSKVSEQYLKFAKSNDKESRTLRNIRGSLFPRLFTGEIDLHLAENS